MSKLKVSTNLFLEVSELNRLVRFLETDGYKQLFRAVSPSPGGILSNTDNTYFKPTWGEDGVVTVGAGVAYTTGLEAIVAAESFTVAVTNVGTKQWLILSRAVTNVEVGTVDISSDGTLIGTGTAFTEVLRGQPNFPTKVCFPNSSVNTGDYEVVSVKSNLSAVLSGSFVAEAGLTYAVVGTFTPGYQTPTDDRLIYEYDSYSVRVQASDDRPTDLGVDEFIIGSVQWVNGAMIVNDERSGSMFGELETNSGSSTNGENPIISLLETRWLGATVNNRAYGLALYMEHGYHVQAWQLLSTASGNNLVITTGSCNFWGDGDVPDGAFNGWQLTNLNTMDRVEVTASVNKTLTIGVVSDDLLVDDADLWLLPPYSFIEYEAILMNDTGAVNTTTPVTGYFAVSTPHIVMPVWAVVPEADENTGERENATWRIRYRFVSSDGKPLPWYEICVAPYVDVDGVENVVADSQFIVNLDRVLPTAEVRNYS